MFPLQADDEEGWRQNLLPYEHYSFAGTEFSEVLAQNAARIKVESLSQVSYCWHILGSF
jgi:hypothetical protein